MFKLSEGMTRTICGIPFRVEIDERWITAIHVAGGVGVAVPAAAFDAADAEAVWQALEVEVDHYWLCLWTASGGV